MLENLPRSYEVVQDWSWSQFEPFYQELLQAELTSANLTEWMEAETRFADLIGETFSRLYVAHTCDTEDQTAEKRYFHIIEEVLPPAQEANNKLNVKLLQSGLKPENFDIPLLKIRTDVEVFRPENLDLFVEDQKLQSEYDKTVGAQTVEWEGEELTLTQLSRVLQDTD